MDKEYKKPQIYNYAEIKADEVKILDQYIGLLKQYDEVMNNLRMFESVKDYILHVKLKPNAKMVLINGQVMSITKKFNESYLKLETDN